MNAEQRSRLMHVTGATRQELQRAENASGDDFLVRLGTVLSERQSVELNEGMTREEWNAERGAMLANRWRINHGDLAALYPLIEGE